MQEKKGKDFNDSWDQLFGQYKIENKEKYEILQRVIEKKLPDSWNDEIETFLREIAEKKRFSFQKIVSSFS